jgi:hypothetical protein
MTWIEIVNKILKAHRERDKVAEAYWTDLFVEVEPTYADSLDLVGYEQ